ncbi:MAG: DNA polymerase IV [Ktedonobacterales bacterium]|nr:DNA polymerase IV [Ktedonobacterales bacterium]
MLTKRFLHLDLDCFYISVEEQHNPALRGQLVAVGGHPQQRGVVASASYAARARGVRSAMPMAQAVRLCPELRIVPPHFNRYEQESQRVMTYLRTWSPLFEQRSIDEAVLRIDSIALAETVLAAQIQIDIRDTLGLPCSLGIAQSRQTAKMAADWGKAQAVAGQPPNAITIVPAGTAATFLAPMPIDALFGVGPKTAAHLQQHGIRTIGDLAQWHDHDVLRTFGQWCLPLAALSRGQDVSDIDLPHQRQSISQERTFTTDIDDPQVLAAQIRRQARAVSRRLCTLGQQGKVVRLKLRWANFVTLTRQVALATPTYAEDSIASAALALFAALWQQEEAPVRLIGIGVDQIGDLTPQLDLWHPQTAERLTRDTHLAATLAQLKTRFGDAAIRWGDEPAISHKEDQMMTTAHLPTVTLYTDGACSGNPGVAGFCAILLAGERRRVLTGGYARSTNNRAELSAVLLGLAALKMPCDVTVYTDASYVIQSAQNCRDLQARHWWRSGQEAVPNWDLLERLIPLLDQHQVTFQQVKGHATDPLNNECDREAVAASHRMDWPFDPGYGRTPPPIPEPPRLFE